MYFSKLSNIEYTQKPIRFPISDKQYVLAKNIFRKFKIKDSAFQSSIFFNKYSIQDNERLDTISTKVYGSPEYDWVIMLVNNIIDPYSDLPINDSNLYDFVTEKYGNPEGIHHYETIEVKDSLGRVVLKEGIHVDSTFYNAPAYEYNNNGTVVSVPGNTVSVPVTNYQYEKTLNDQRREIFLLRPELLEKFVNEFESLNEYSRSTDYINRKTKKSN